MQNLPPNTAVFIDYSNIFFTKYTVGRHFNLENLLQWCDSQPSISLIGMYGAFDNRNLTQTQRKNTIEASYKDNPKFIMYFKPLEQHGSKQKGNVDTEMGFDLAEYQERFEHLVLFSGDGDFYYPLEKLIEKGKDILVCSTKGHISGLLNLTRFHPQSVAYLDYNHATNPDAFFLRQIVVDTVRGLAVDPVMQKFLATASLTELRYLYDFLDTIMQGNQYTNSQALFFKLKNKNNYPLYKIVAKNRNVGEQNALKTILQSLI